MKQETGKNIQILPAEPSSIALAAEFIEEQMEKAGVDRRAILKTSLVAEETLLQMVHNAPSAETELKLAVIRRFGRTSIRIECRGTAFRDAVNNVSGSIADLSALEDDQAEIISRMILRSYSDQIHIRNIGGINKAVISVPKGKKSVAAVFRYMLLGVLAGLLLRFLLPPAVSTYLTEKVFSLGSNLFLRATMMIISPLVFFSIADSVTGFSDYSAFGRLGGKVIGMYFMTTLAAIMFGILYSLLIHPGSPEILPAVMEYAANAAPQQAAAISIYDTLLGIVPANIVNAFAQNDMLALIFLAVFCGIVSGSAGKYSQTVQEFFHAGNAFFQRMVELLIRFLPVAVFCIMANMAITLEGNTFRQQIRIIAALAAAIASMMVFYMLLLLVFGRVNPLQFLKKYREAMLVAFSSCSSNAAMPVSMRCLGEMGVSPKVYSFSIPLGATINMDGVSILYIAATMFMMRVFSVPMTLSVMLPLVISVIALSVGTPAVTGAAFACLAMLFSQAGIPGEAVGFMIAITTLTDYMITLSNVTGDAVVSFLVAKREGLVDMEKFRQ